MSEANRAVFLSYAREDLAAARRIAEALRAGGLEVWFDEEELRGGDTWDAKIRGQIGSCALFLPVISAQTQARAEGYFRREWKLADHRTEDMGRRRAFLVPVCIDDTKDAEADVPDSFLRVQWTRLPGALPTPQFVEQVKRLLSGEQGAGGKEQGAQKTEGRGQRTEVSPESRRSGLPGWTWGALTAVIVGIATALWVASQPKPSAPPPASSLPPPAAAAAAAAAEVKPMPMQTVIPLKPDKSIAVLPFANRSNREEDLFFTDGVHDDLLTQISRIRAIKTISRTSVMQYRGTTKNLRTIGQELGAATILEGGIQRSGNRIRINVQLIDAATDAHIWAETYDRELTAENIFKIQTEVATAIATALQAALLPEEQKQLEKLPTNNLAALEAFFQGQAGIWKYTAPGMREAARQYQRAVELDPSFARAYARLASVYVYQSYFEGLPAAVQNAKAEPLVKRALELDPHSNDAYIALGQLRRDQGAYAESEAALQRAIELNPNDPFGYQNYALLLRWNLGRPAEAVELIKKARTLEPRDPGLDSMTAEFLQPLGRIDEARAIMEASVRDNPGFAQGYRTLGILYGQEFGLYDQAVQALRKGHALDPGSPVCPGLLARLFDWIGENEQAAEWYERTLQISPDSLESSFRRAAVHRLRGEREKELAVSEAAVRSPASVGPYLSVSLAVLRDHDLSLGRTREIRARYATAYPAFFEGPVPAVTLTNIDAVIGVSRVLLANGEKERADLLLNAAKPLAVANHNDQALLSIQTLLGDKRAAIATLQRRVDRGTVRADFGTEPPASDLRTEPEFAPLLEKVRVRLAAQRDSIRQLEASGQLAPIPDLPAKP